MPVSVKLGMAASSRSNLMAAVRSKDTKPEMRVRRLLHALGYRFRLHVKDLPGKPDVVLPKYGAIFMINGCFWHMHTCDGGHMPRQNTSYWTPKLLKNAARDLKNVRALRRIGWSVYVIWECRLDSTSDERLASMLRSKLDRAFKRMNSTQRRQQSRPVAGNTPSGR